MGVGLMAGLMAGATALNLGGSMLNSHIDRTFNAQQAQLQRDFEERMSNSAYQRAVADMKSAGLNPYMLYSSGGSGASTPSGATASHSSSLGNVGEPLASFVNTLLNSKTARDVALLKAQSRYYK